MKEMDMFSPIQAQLFSMMMAQNQQQKQLHQMFMPSHTQQQQLFHPQIPTSSMLNPLYAFACHNQNNIFPALTAAASPDITQSKRTPKVNSKTAEILIEWFEANKSHPYPTEEDMKNFKAKTGYTDTQLGDWFRNRRRNLKKKNAGNVPWNVPTTIVRKRRANSFFEFMSESNVSSSSDSTASSTPVLSALLNAKSPSSNSCSTPPTSDISNLSSEAAPPPSLDGSGEIIDVETVDENILPTLNSPQCSVGKSEDTVTPATKRPKLWSVNDIIRSE